MIDASIRTIDPPALVAKVREMDAWLQKEVLPRYGDWLP